MRWLPLFALISIILIKLNAEENMKLKVEESMKLKVEENPSLFWEKSSLFWIMLIGIVGFTVLFICGYCV